LQPTSGTNAFGQSSSTAYGPSQQGLPTSTTDANGQVTGLSYSYDSRGNGTIQVSQPGETLGYTTQSSTNANACPASIPTSIHLPCYEIDTSTALYSPAVSRTFYDALGRAVETRSTGPGVYDTVSFTVYNDAAHTVFQSVPFEVVDGSGWLDPNGATDYTGHAPGGTASFYDALGRLVAVQDPLYGTSPDGISCSATLTGTYTACTNYSLGSDSGDPNISDTNIYATTSSIDANNHVSKSFTDALGRTVYTQTDSGGGSNNGPLSPIQQQSVQYNALNEPIQVRVDDLAPQNNQVVTSVLTTAQYDALGRLTQLVDADRGTHTYSYDPDGHLVSDVSGSRTIGTNLDLLGRVGCVQDMAPVLNASGSCTSGSHPLVQNTYDTSKLGTQGSTDFPIGRLTKSLTTTYFPEGGSATTTQKYQYDQRGRVITEQLLLKLPNSWNVSPGPPTYQVALSYTDTNQPTTAITSTVNPTGSGFTSTQVYDPTGALLGLGSSSNPVANLATLSYNVNAQVGSITYLTSTGSSNVAQEQFSYDGNLRPFEASATWQSGSGSSGQIFDQVRNYDAAGNVVSLTTTQASVPGQSSSGGSETENFCYDEQNRLVWAGNSGSQPGAGHGTCGSGTLANTLSGASYTNTFASTNLGQLWKAPVNGTGGYQQYLYCDSSHPHQLTGIYPTGTTCTNPTGAVYSTSYDAWGNVTSRTYSGSTATLSYDQLDRMVEWQNSTTNAQEWYLYDASGNRVLRRSTSNGTTTLTTYPFSSEEHTYSGTGTLQSSIYYYRLGGRLIGDLTGSPAQTNLFLTDALGSVLATFSNTATTAALLGNQTYRPYGSQQYQSGSLGTNKGFTGQYADATGLDYYNARYYDPVAGVFLSADTVQGNTKGMNPYGYVQGNPETWSDPTGAYVACGDTCGQGPGTGSGGGASSPASTSTNTGWLTFPFKIHPPTTPSTPNQNNPNLSPCGGMSIQDCMSLWYATGIHYQGYTTTSIKIGLDGPGFTLYGPTGLIWTGFHSSFTVQTLTPVSGTVVMPLGGCASLFSCLTSNEGVDERLPEDYALFQCSFTASTKVTTQEGTQAIGTLKPGEKVLAYNPKTRQMELQPILHVWINHDTDLVDLTLTTRTHAPHSSVVTTTSEVIHTNKKHPFLTIEHGFLSVGQITLGMHILRADGQVGVVTGWKMVPGGKTMYNLEVQQDHTYTVGVGQWVVHNSDGCGGDNNPFSPGTDYAGDYERQFQSSQGPIGILANGRVEGTTLILEDVAIYPTASEKPLTIGVREILQFRNQIAREVASWGFDTLEIRGLRMPNSTSANPGKVVNLPPINLEPFGP
jgi:RHS repeat-associated protein